MSYSIYSSCKTVNSAQRGLASYGVFWLRIPEYWARNQYYVWAIPHTLVRQQLYCWWSTLPNYSYWSLCIWYLGGFWMWLTESYMYMCIYHSICDHHIHATLAAGPISIRGIVKCVYVYVSLYMYMSLQLIQCVRSLLCHCEYSICKVLTV